MKKIVRKLVCALMAASLMMSLSGCSVIREMLAEPTEREYAGEFKPEWSGEPEESTEPDESGETDGSGKVKTVGLDTVSQREAFLSDSILSQTRNVPLTHCPPGRMSHPDRLSLTQY